MASYFRDDGYYQPPQTTAPTVAAIGPTPIPSSSSSSGGGYSDAKSMILKIRKDMLRVGVEKRIELNQRAVNEMERAVPLMLMVGETKVGKSTLANWLCNVPLEKQRRKLNVVQDYNGVFSPIGMSGKSETLVPVVVPGNTVNCVDMPGFGDSRGLHATMICHAATKYVLSKQLENYGVHTVCIVINYAMLYNRRGAMLEKVHDSLKFMMNKYEEVYDPKYRVVFLLNKFGRKSVAEIREELKQSIDDLDNARDVDVKTKHVKMRLLHMMRKRFIRVDPTCELDGQDGSRDVALRGLLHEPQNVQNDHAPEPQDISVAAISYPLDQNERFTTSTWFDIMCREVEVHLEYAEQIVQEWKEHERAETRHKQSLSRAEQQRLRGEENFEGQAAIDAEVEEIKSRITRCEGSIAAKENEVSELQRQLDQMEINADEPVALKPRGTDDEYFTKHAQRGWLWYNPDIIEEIDVGHPYDSFAIPTSHNQNDGVNIIETNDTEKNEGKFSIKWDLKRHYNDADLRVFFYVPRNQLGEFRARQRALRATITRLQGGNGEGNNMGEIQMLERRISELTRARQAVLKRRDVERKTVEAAIDDIHVDIAREEKAAKADAHRFLSYELFLKRHEELYGGKSDLHLISSVFALIRRGNLIDNEAGEYLRILNKFYDSIVQHDALKPVQELITECLRYFTV